MIVRFFSFCLAWVVTTVVAAPSDSTLTKADSLFGVKQYTQSLELYQQLLDHHQYSPSMLLKMAYIQEGLGRIGPSLYCLNLYYLSTNDAQADLKIQTVATKNHLEGYGTSNREEIRHFLHEHEEKIAALLATLSVLIVSWIYYRRTRQKVRPLGAWSGLVVLLALLGVLPYYSSGEHAIIAVPNTYLMSGPSAGADVVAIVGEGHRLEILGHNDVWVKVEWADQEVFVKADQLLTVQL